MKMKRKLSQYDSASETHEDVFHDWMPGEEPNVTEERCFVCLTPTWELINSNIRYFQSKFCICAGAVGTSCETCIKQEIIRVPTACRVCNTPWRRDQVRFIYTPMSYAEFVWWLRRHYVFESVAGSIDVALTGLLLRMTMQGEEYTDPHIALVLLHIAISALAMIASMLFFVATFIVLCYKLLPFVSIILYGILRPFLPTRPPLIDVEILGD